MASLVLGVLDVAYSDAGGSSGEATTTGEVAEKLEERYGVMQAFYDSRKEKIAQFLADDMAHAITDIAQGKPVESSQSRGFANKYHGINEKYSISSFTYGADKRIESEFNQFIFSNEMQKLSIATTGAPISVAAARGITKRKISKKNKSRPAFVDTGLYVTSMLAWTEK